MEENEIFDAVEEVTEDGVGNIKIAVDVVATIAGIAASSVEGVASMYSSIAGGLAEMLGAKKSPGKGVKVEMKENNVVVDIFIVVDYGVKIPELAWEIQENVKNSLETMTGLEVEKVNIHIEGVSFEKEKQAAAAAVMVDEADIEEMPSADAIDEVPDME